MLVLTASDIRRALPMRAAIETQKRAYSAVGNRTAALPLRAVVSVPEQETILATLIEDMRDSVGAALVAVPTPAGAVRNADVICCATTSSTPVFDGRDLKPGAHVNGVGSYTLQMQEVGSHAVHRAGRAFVDSRESFGP